MSVPLVEARGLVKTYHRRAGVLDRSGGMTVRALDGVDLSVAAGECVALVGESGSGKTTLGRCLLRLQEPDAGQVRFRGEDLLALDRRSLRRLRRRLQMVFQDPVDSLNPRMRVGSAVAEPLAVHRVVPPGRRAERVAELLETVGLGPELARRFPHELSGGQRQRIGIARALATEPELVVADEPVSALDTTVRARILDLLRDLRQRLGLGLLLIAHDLAMVERTADRVVVLYRGRVVEEAPVAELFARPRQDYTRRLLEAIPRLDAGARRGRARSDPPA